MYKQARKQAGLSIEEAAFRLHIGTRTLCKYEAGETLPAPEVALAMGQLYRAPALTMLYCRKECAIGRAYCYNLLNNVDLSPIAILSKYRQEEREAHEALERMTELMLNKRGRDDCTEAELRELYRWALEMLDLEHVIETLKLRLWDFLDVRQLMAEHNRKCEEKRYYDPRQPELKLAG
jgi:transcriptional regulator with XRE-family HTH domain